MIKTWPNFMEYCSGLTGVCNRSGVNLKKHIQASVKCYHLIYVLYSNLNIPELFIVFGFKLFNLCLQRTISTCVDNKIIQDQIKISLVLLSHPGPQAHK